MTHTTKGRNNEENHSNTGNHAVRCGDSSQHHRSECSITSRRLSQRWVQPRRRIENRKFIRSIQWQFNEPIDGPFFFIEELVRKFEPVRKCKSKRKFNVSIWFFELWQRFNDSTFDTSELWIVERHERKSIGFEAEPWFNKTKLRITVPR
jgi:hypothetical protein